MTDPDYQINELASKAGVSVRTIRFYIDEGLLPPPAVHGRYAVYSDEYLERLELIRLLKDRFLPLKEIRRQVSGLSAQEVKEALLEERQWEEKYFGDQEPRIGKPGSNALEYISRLMEKTPGSPRSPAGMGSQLHEQRGTYPTLPAHEETWERIHLAPGVELHILRGGKIDQLRLKELVQFARKLFS